MPTGFGPDLFLVILLVFACSRADLAPSPIVLDNIYRINSESEEFLEDKNTDGAGLFEVDIVLDNRARWLVFGKGDGLLHAATSNNEILWPNGRVVYTFESNLENQQDSPEIAAARNAVLSAMAVISNKTCLVFARRVFEADYIEFVRGSGCWSLVGRGGSKQQISVGSGCESTGIMIHEIMHSLGFWHEQSRPDRDNYVRVEWDNVIDGYSGQFKKYDKGEIDTMGLTYDYGSIMHYGLYAFSKNSKPTLTVLNPTSVAVGQRTALTSQDILQMNRLYKCPPLDVVINGNWAEWTAWMPCSQECGGGVQKRYRTCSSPTPRNNGLPCSGPTFQEQECNTQICSDSCNFDLGMCTWTHLTDGQFSWLRFRGPTPTTKTGPIADHTKNDDTGYYVYIESSRPRVPGEVARLISGPRIGSKQSECMSFWFHMYGATTGSLTILSHISSAVQEKVLWNLDGEQGDQWQKASIPLNIADSYQIIIEGKVGRGFLGDIAVDDILIKDGTCNQSPPASIPSISVTRMPKIVQTTTADPEVLVTTSPPTTTSTTTTTTTIMTTVPTTIKTTPNPYDHGSCNFEDGFCQWIQDTQDYLDWSRQSGPSLQQGNGPATDHTFNTPNQGFYALLDARRGKLGHYARLLLPVVNSRHFGCMEFWYFTHGSRGGSLEVLLQVGKFVNQPLWSSGGSSVPAWTQARIQLKQHGSYTIVISAKRGSPGSGDIAIDDVSFKLGSCV